jgi:7-cyano-7-deazaguanine synthase in queuosine biosynthesis
MANKELVLVCCSGGFDSTLTTCVLKKSGYENIICVHFKYGHRGQDAEEIAIQNVCAKLEIPLRVFDLESLYKTMDTTDISMLQDKDAEIVTGTTKGLKTTAAWTPARNLLFLTIMGALGETECMKHDYGTIHLAGGMLQLSESATYPDNTPYFFDAVKGALKYGTLVGDRFKPLYGLSNLMKHEQYQLMRDLDLVDIYKHTISCDRPIVKDILIHSVNGVDIVEHQPRNCSKDGIPACGSGLLAYWSSKMIGMDDMKIRNFYEVDDPDYIAHIPKHLANKEVKESDINSIIDRILLPQDKLDRLKELVK